MLKWAFVGASNIASEWMVGAVRAAGDEVVAVVSGSAARAAGFAQQHGIAHALDQLDGLRRLELDAVYVSNTNDRHEQAVLLAAELGCHVLCEKPLALDIGAARRMVDACRDAGVVMATNHHLRHNSAHRQMRGLLRTQGLGRLVAARVSHSVHLRAKLQGWRIDNAAAGGGVVLDIAVHNADSLAFLLGEYPVEVMAMSGSSGMGRGVEDQAMSLWQFPSGLCAFTHQGFNTPHASNRLEILGDQACLEARGVLNQTPGGELVWRRADGDLSLRLDHDNLYLRGLRELHKAIAGEDSDMASGEDGLRSLAVALAVRRRFARDDAQRIAFTFGAQGAYLWIDGQEATAMAPRIDVVDTVGAGDTFWGSCLADWAHQPAGAALRIEATLKRAMRAAAINCSRAGCQPPRLHELVQEETIL